MQILTTKLYPPPLRPGNVTRSRLLGQLNEGLRRKLTLVSAPAGFGKSMLLSEWLSQVRARCCWITLDELDNDLGRFAAYLLSGMAKAKVTVDPQLLVLLQASVANPVETIMVPLINAATTTDEHVALVLDDYHLIRNKEIHSLTAYLLAHAPPNLHTVIATRADPPLSLARLRAQGQTMEIRAEDLRFTTAEAEVFLTRALERKLPSDTVAMLVRRTDGWISGLQMAALSLRTHEDPEAFVASFAGSHQYVFDYLTEEVLSKQPPRMRRFLLRTSILKRLRGSLCDAVSGLPEGRRTLEMLQESNAFIVALDEERTWFRYHQLFADMLLQRLMQEEPEQVPLLHMRAWSWFRQQDLLAEAIDHALAAQAYDQAAAAIEIAAERTLLHGEIETFLRWAEALPVEVLRDKPLLSLYQAEALLLSGQSFQDVAERMRGAPEHLGLQALASAYLGDVENSKRLTAAALRELPEEHTFIRTVITSAMSAMLMVAGDARAAVDGFAESVSLAKRSGNLLLAVIGSVRRSQLLAILGEDAAARDASREALDLAQDEEGRLRPLASFPLTNVAYLSYLANDLDEALNAAKQALAISEKYGGFWALDCHITYAFILQARGVEAEATAAMTRARELSQQTRANPVDDLYAAAYAARLAIAQGRLDAAREWARERLLIDARGQAVPPVRALMFHVQELEQLTLARLYLAEGNSAAALAVLQWLVPIMLELGRKGSVGENYLLQALGCEMRGEHVQAVKHLAAALDLVDPRYRLRLIMDQRPAIDPVLDALMAHRSADEEMGELFAEAPLPARQDRAAIGDELVETLSDREAEVLNWLCTELTVPEIAEELHVTTSTLRTHVRNIYGKLGVHSRFEAVVKGQELGLV